MGALLILPLAAALAFTVRRRIEETIAPAVVLMILLLFLSGLSGSLTPGYYACLAVCILALPAALLNLFLSARGGKETRPVLLRYLLTPGLIAYLLFFFFFLLINRTRLYVHGTDFLHWGIAARDFFTHNSFSNIAAAMDLFPKTPPGTTLWIYFSLRLKDVYEESAAFLAQEMLQAAVFLPLFSVIRRRADAGRFCILFLSLLVLPMAVSAAYAYTTLSPVFLQGITAAMLLRSLRGLLRRKSAGELLYTASLFVLLSLAGYGGLLIACIFLVLLIARTLIAIIHYREPVRDHLIPCLMAAVPVMISVAGRAVFFAVAGDQNNMNAAAMVQDMAAPLDGVKHPLTILFLVLNGLSRQSVSGTVGHAFPVSVLTFFVLLAVGIAACLVMRKRHPALPAFSRTYLIYVGAGILLYLVALYLVYLFRVPAARTDELAYMDLALIPVTAFSLTRLLSRAVALSVTSERIRGAVWSVLLWCSLLSVNLGSLFLLGLEEPASRDDYALSFAYEQGFSFSPGDRIFFIDRPDTVLYDPYRSYMEESETRIGALYYTLTEEVPVYVNLSSQDLRRWETNTRTDMTLHEVNDLLRRERYRYVYIASRGMDFTHHYAALFPDTEALENGQFFAVSVFDDGVVQLQTISRKEDMTDWVR